MGVAAFLLFARIMTRVILAPGIVADPAFGRIGPMQAIQLGWRATGGRTWSIFALLLVTGVIAALTVLLLCVGWVLLGVPHILATYGAVHQLVNRPLAAAPSV